MNSFLGYSAAMLSTILGVLGWITKNSGKASTALKVLALCFIIGAGVISISSVYFEAQEKAKAQSQRQQAEADLNAIKSEISQKPRLTVALNGTIVRHGQACVIHGSNGVFSLEFRVSNDGRRTATQVEIAIIPPIPISRLSQTPLPWQVHEPVVMSDRKVYPPTFPYNWLHLDLESSLSPASTILLPPVLISQSNNTETLACPIKVSCAEKDPEYLLLNCLLLLN